MTTKSSLCSIKARIHEVHTLLSFKPSKLTSGMTQSYMIIALRNTYKM